MLKITELVYQGWAVGQTDEFESIFFAFNGLLLPWLIERGLAKHALVNLHWFINCFVLAQREAVFRNVFRQRPPFYVRPIWGATNSIGLSVAIWTNMH